MDDIRVDEVPIPASIEAEDAGEFVAAVQLAAAVRKEAFGDHLVFRPREELFTARDSHHPRRMFVARLDDRIVGRGELSVLSHDPKTAWLAVDVLPHHRRTGIGSRLLETVEREAAATGRTHLVADVRVVETAGPRIDAPTGYGSVPAESPETRFLLRHGYTLEQVIRVSHIDLPIPGITGMLAETRAFAGSDYALHHWIAKTPDHWLDDLASLKTRMTTDIPSGDIEMPVDVWTPERVAAEDVRRIREDDSRLVVTAVEHVPSGRLVGYSEFLVPAEAERDSIQWFTVVDPEHRGHRLGALVKFGNLKYLASEFPDRPGIVTGNAEQNRPMLDINERLGFVAMGHHGAWKKVL